MTTSSLRGWLALVAALSAIAWIAVGLLFERYSNHSRYAGYGIFAILYLGALPGAALVALVLHWIFPKLGTLWAIVGLGSGGLMIAYALLTVIAGERSLVERRRRAADEELARAALAARIERDVAALSFEQRLATLRDRNPDRPTGFEEAIVGGLLADPELWPSSGESAASERLLQTITALAQHYPYAIHALAPKLLGTPHPLRARLVTTMLQGLKDAPSSELRVDRARSLLEVEPSGVWLSEAKQVWKLRDDEQAELAHRLLTEDSDPSRAALVAILGKGWTTRSAEHPRSTAEAFRAQFDDETWQRGLSARDQTFYEALRTRDPSPPRAR